MLIINYLNNIKKKIMFNPPRPSDGAEPAKAAGFDEPL